jgi:Fe2+ or Zn2+ uptake regulation protein
MQRETLQRKIILKEIHELGHVSKSEFIKHLKTKYKDFNLATIYRNLDTLCEDNLLRKVSTNLDEDIYEDTTKKMHDHFICNECGSIIDVESKDNKAPFIDEFGNLIKSKSTTYYGICVDCLNKKKNL